MSLLLPLFPARRPWELIFRYVPKTWILELRLVCKEWEQIISENYLQSAFIFTVNGKKPRSIHAFKNLPSTSKLGNFRFLNLDLEAQLLGDPDIFRKFSNTHCRVLRSLIIKNCLIGTGRLFELLAFCTNMKFLGICDTPQIYNVGLDIFHWGFCMESLRKNLAGLHKLRLRDTEISDHNLWGIAGEMKNLRSLQVNVKGRLPTTAICNVLFNNADTLEDLNLRGVMFEGDINEENHGTLEQLPDFYLLSIITLDEVQCWSESQSQFLKHFFRKCPNLLDLYISDTNMERNPLYHVDRQLIRLILFNCHCSSGSDNYKFDQLQTLRMGLTRKSCMETKAVKCIQNLLKCKKPLLGLLELRSVPNATSCLNLITIGAFPSLRHLYLIDLCDIFVGMSLKNVLRNFPELESLSFRSCQGVDDEAFVGIGISGGLAQMKNLHFLDLSCTNVGNLSASFITKLKSLTELYMTETNLNNFGLSKIIDGVRFGEMPELCHIDIRDSKCYLNMDILRAACEEAPNLFLRYYR